MNYWTKHWIAEALKNILVGLMLTIIAIFIMAIGFFAVVEGWPYLLGAFALWMFYYMGKHWRET